MKWLDPVSWFGEDGYSNLVDLLVQALFNGTVARIVSLIFLIVGVWFVYRRKQTGAGLGFVILSVFVTFSKGVLNYLGL